MSIRCRAARFAAAPSARGFWHVEWNAKNGLRPVLQPSVHEVKTAFVALQTAASGLTADNFKQKAPSIATAMKQVPNRD
jgi:hypothetical protein